MLETLTYNDLLQSPKWQQRRESILQRDNHRCRHCGKAENLQVHHKQYHIRKGSGTLVRPWEYQDQYLISLCRTCHQSGHLHYKIPVFTI